MKKFFKIHKWAVITIPIIILVLILGGAKVYYDNNHLNGTYVVTDSVDSKTVGGKIEISGSTCIIDFPTGVRSYKISQKTDSFDIGDGLRLRIEYVDDKTYQGVTYSDQSSYSQVSLKLEKQ